MRSTQGWLTRRGRGLLVILTLTGALLRLSAVTQAADHPNFSGNWQADTKTSDFGPMPPPDKAVMTVTHQEPQLTIKSELSTGGQSRTWEATCKTDGSECKSTDGEVTLNVSWQAETLVVNRALSFNGIAVKIKETWTLSADGKTLTSARALMTDQG